MSTSCICSCHTGLGMGGVDVGCPTCSAFHKPVPKQGDLLDYICEKLIVTDEDLEAVIVMLIEAGSAPAADYLGRRLRAKPMRRR